MTTGKCPKCEKSLSSVTVQPVDVKLRFRGAYRGVYYLCPFCHSILSVGLDPIALKADTVAALKKALGK